MNVDEPTPHLVWTDLETTGIDPRDPDAAVLEIASIVTDSELNAVGEVADFRVVIAWNGDRDRLHPAVVEMHTANGLLDEAGDNAAVRHDAAERLWAGWLEAAAEAASAERLTLAGATPSFDMAWIEEHLPAARRHLHYRLFDVSTLRQAALWWAGDTLGAQPGDEIPHRAMDDIRGTLDHARNAKRRISSRPGAH